MGAGVEAERPRWPEPVTVSAIPHKRVGNEDVGLRIGVAYAPNRIAAGGCSKVELARGGGAGEDAAVIRASTAVVDPKRVTDRNVATRSPTEARLGCCENEKRREGQHNKKNSRND